MSEVRVVARRPAGVRVVVERALPMLYAEGADLSTDRPAFVRAGSGATWFRGRLAVVLDDTAFIALVDPATGMAHAVPLPVSDGVRQFGESRGNKARKADLESVLTLPDGRLVAFGSGSTAARERLLVWSESDPPRWVAAPALYAMLRAETRFSGSEINVEGATVFGASLRLFNRGNGAPRDGMAPRDATMDLPLEAFLALLDEGFAGELHPGPTTPYDLGCIDGVPFGFTDGVAWPNRGRVAFSAAAEASPDTFHDGACAGAAFGWIDATGEAFLTPVTLADGSPFNGKIEGLAFDEGDPTRVWAVVDADDEAAPSVLCALRLDGI